MTGRTYSINEIFYSIQGEGMRAGTANVFVRFSGCNMECRMEPGPKSPGGFDCDTEFVSGRKFTAAELETEMSLAFGEGCAPGNGLDRWAVLTGGEPGLQFDADLLEFLHSKKWSIAIETNGSLELPSGIDWVTVSPKVAEHALRQLVAHEVKYVRGYGQAIPRTRVEAKNKLLSPAHNGLDVDRKALDWCIKLIKENPEWRLSIQMHKAWLHR